MLSSRAVPMPVFVFMYAHGLLLIHFRSDHDVHVVCYNGLVPGGELM